MSEFIAACVQMRSGRTVEDNIAQADELVRAAAAQGAAYVQTPEMTNLLVRSKAELFERISLETEDDGLRRFRDLAAQLGIWLHIGSMAIRVGDDKAVNRAYLLAPDGRIATRYDKIHMFDVDLPNGESWRESATYVPGEKAILADLPWLRLGLAICYDIRFPKLFRAYAHQGAGLLSAPAAFTRQTGEAHWHVLQRNRAIENGAFMVSAAQGGKHEDGRETFGHSVIVDPWGKVLAEIDGDEPGVVCAAVDTDLVAKVRQRIPGLQNERDFTVTVGGEE